MYALRDLTGHCYMHFAFVFTLKGVSVRTAQNRLLWFGAFAFFRGPAFGNGRSSSGDRGVAFSVPDAGRRVLGRLLCAGADAWLSISRRLRCAGVGRSSTTGI